MLLSALLSLACLLGTARADPAATSDAMDRLSEILELRVEDGLLPAEVVMPALLVSATPRYQASEVWYAARAIEVIQRAFGEHGLRLCEACMAPRTYSSGGGLVYQTGPLGLDEIVRLDELSRGDAPPARTAIWLDEHRGGVAIRVVELSTGRVLFAQNVDPSLTELSNTERVYTLSAELERRSRGDSLTQAFADFALYPGQHISLDWTDQWGPTNNRMSGVTLSILDPIVGLGASHYRVTGFINTMVGGKIILSLPTAVAQSVGDDVDLIDPLVTIVGLARVPFGQSNYGGVVSISTNGQVGIGISLLNFSLLPVLP